MLCIRKPLPIIERVCRSQGDGAILEKTKQAFFLRALVNPVLLLPTDTGDRIMIGCADTAKNLSGIGHLCDLAMEVRPVLNFDLVSIDLGLYISLG
jgi:hypothetical protein